MTQEAAHGSELPIPRRAVRAVLATAIVLTAVLVAGAFRAPAHATAPAQAKLYGVGTPPLAQMSSASCAASACHGGGHIGKKGSEYSTWAPDLFADGPHDPHAKAYRVLFNADSARMGKLLGVAAPHEHALCLKCHAVDAVKPQLAVAEGVGCGACHGPAQKWLAAHVEPGWKELTNRAKWENYGFVPAGNLVARSMNCVGCHVGDADREVSHDLIAAGHPRLAFESVRFHTSPHYRKHWEEKSPDFAVRAWVAGQAATLRAATELLRARADRAANDHPSAVWPEFAGYSCSACHQKVGLGELQRDASATTRPVGLPAWELWSNAVPVAAKFSGEVFPGAPVTELREVAALRTLMQQRVPNPTAVAAKAAKAVAELDAWLAALQAAEDRGERMKPDTARKIAHGLAKGALNCDRTKLADHDWDALAASYLGCDAMHHPTDSPDWSAPLRGLRDELRFPAAKAGVGVPAGFGRKERDRARDHFRELFDATESKR
jgi:hypothetical protein